MSQVLKGKVALVAGATRGAGRGIAVELGAAGATVYLTGRTTRTQRSEYNRSETIEETADLVRQAGGEGIAVRDIMHLGLSFDHRIFDGAVAVQFLNRMKAKLEGFPGGDAALTDF